MYLARKVLLDPKLVLNSTLQSCYFRGYNFFHNLFFSLKQTPSVSFVCLFLFVDTVDSITPDKVRGLRDMLNSSAMDIMYYTSPLYRDEVSIVIIKVGVRQYSRINSF